MKVRQKPFACCAVSAVIALGIAIIAVSLHANRGRLDRETSVAAAKYDGAALFARLEGMDATATTVPEIETGPLSNDLGNLREAWIVWRQTFSSALDLGEIVAWHRSRIEPLGWTLREESPDKTTFSMDHWTLELIRLPDGAGPDPLRFERKVSWRNGAE